jgi:AraC-like DNA-binding protein
MLQQPPTTVPVVFVHSLLAGVKALGEPCDAFLAEAEIPLDLMTQASARVTAIQYISLLRILIERREDEGLGFLSRPLKPGSFGLIARSALGAHDLETAIRRVARTFWILQDDVKLELQHAGDLAGLVMHFNGSLASPAVFLHELLLRVFWRLLAWLAGGRLPAARFDFAFDTPAHAADYGRIFPAPLMFGQPLTGVWFDVEWLKRQVRRDERAVRAFLANAQENMIAPQREHTLITARVRAHLQGAIPLWPDLVATAAALHMSVPTLQRRLATEGTSFQSLKDELRRDMSIVRLNTSEVSLAELAVELGFADSPTFQRAFKGWTGSTPGAYRRHGK